MSSYIFQSLNTAGHTRKFRNVAGAGNIKVQEKLVLPVKKKKKKPNVCGGTFASCL